MWKFFEKLQALPEETRKIVVLFSAGMITAILLVSWLVFPAPHFGELSAEEKSRKNAENLLTPFSIIGGEIHESVGGIKEKWASFGGGVSSEIATTTATTTTAKEIL